MKRIHTYIGKIAETLKIRRKFLIRVPVANAFYFFFFLHIDNNFFEWL